MSQPTLNVKTPRIAFAPGTEGKRVYLASAFSNAHHAALKFSLDHSKFDVYDYRDHSFEWEEYRTEAVPELNSVLTNERAVMLARDYNASALKNCDVAVLLLPSGRDAHGDAMIALGMGKRVYAYAPTNYVDPSLLYGFLSDPVFTDMSKLVEKMKWDAGRDSGRPS